MDAFNISLCSCMLPHPIYPVMLPYSYSRQSVRSSE
jgi:hypothetical protein